MLSVFPTMFLSLLAHAILRIITGFVLLRIARSRFRKTQNSALSLSLLIPLGLFEVSMALMFIFGALTQIAALGLLLYACFFLIFHRYTHAYAPDRKVLVLCIGIALSLFITGAGAFAFDMPF